MIKKIFIVLIVGFVAQTIVSCSIFDCGCPDPIRFEVLYDSVEAVAINTRDPNGTIYGKADKMSFGIMVQAIYAEAQLGMNNFCKFSIFKPANACGCEPSYYDYPEYIANLKVFIINKQFGVATNVSSAFFIDTGASQVVKIHEYFSSWYNERNKNTFRIVLNNGDVIPSATTFEVQLILGSGNIISGRTQQVQFKN